jgi:hypothetical protein
MKKGGNITRGGMRWDKRSGTSRGLSVNRRGAWRAALTAGQQRPSPSALHHVLAGLTAVDH